MSPPHLWLFFRFGHIALTSLDRIFYATKANGAPEILIEVEAAGVCLSDDIAPG